MTLQSEIEVDEVEGLVLRRLNLFVGQKTNNPGQTPRWAQKGGSRFIVWPPGITLKSYLPAQTFLRHALFSNNHILLSDIFLVDVEGILCLKSWHKENM